MKIKQVGGIRRGHIQPYIYEFLWQQEIKCRGEDRFLAILNAIKKHFPLNSNQKPQYNL